MASNPPTERPVYEENEESFHETPSFEKSTVSRFLLLCSVARCGTADWVRVSTNIEGLSNRQCRERFEVHEKPGLMFHQPTHMELLDLTRVYLAVRAENVGTAKLYCELRDRTYSTYRRSNMWLKQRFMRMERTGELGRLVQEIEASGIQPQQ